MEFKPVNPVYTHTTYADFNEKYARIAEKSKPYAFNLQKFKSDDLIFRTQSQDNLESDTSPDTNSTRGGCLFISGSCAPFTSKKPERRVPKTFKVPLPKPK